MLNKANIGIAMGRRGAQVAQKAAGMILKDDAFNTIVVAIEQGRAIFNNIRKFILFLLSGNIGEIMIVTFAILAGAPLPILPLQILYLNMIGDVFPALALAMGRADARNMQKPPRDPAESILTSRRRRLDADLIRQSGAAHRRAGHYGVTPAYFALLAARSYRTNSGASPNACACSSA